MRKPSLVLVACLGAFVPAAHAHHSFPAVFDDTQPVAVTGTIVRVEWTNPHIWFFVEVENPAARSPSGGSPAHRQAS
jgi:hypothetical protein